MRALFFALLTSLMFSVVCSVTVAEPIKTHTVTKDTSVTLPDEEDIQSAETAEVVPLDAEDLQSAEAPEKATVTGARELEIEPSEATPTPAVAEELAREIEKRRREERERREIELKMALIRLRVRQQLQQNDIWYQDALDEEVEYVRDGEEHFEDKEYRDAKDCYLDAIEITFPQWIFNEKTIRIIKTDEGWYRREGFEPSFEKRDFHLSTEFTRLALTRLAVIDRLIAEYDLITARLKADTAYETGELGKAYRLYTDALEIARKMGRSAFAERYSDEINVMRESLFAEAALPLGVAEAALAASSPAAALAAMNEFKEKYADLAFIPELKARYLALNKNPSIVTERREQSALNMIAVGDAAVARKDYRTALRWYRRASTMYAGTQAGELAGRKRDALMADPAVVKAIERQEMEHVSKAMTARAETFASWGKVTEAVKVYDELIANYPGTEHAAKALEARKALEALAKEKPSPALEPPAREEE